MSKKLNPIQKEMLEVLKDTIEYYSNDVSRRGIREDTIGLCFEKCQFLTPENRKCAVGRYLNKKDLENIADKDLLDCGICNFFDGGSSYSLSTRIVKRLPLKFWKDLQKLHDTRSYWGSETGITSSGKKIVESIKNKIINGKYEHV